ncbi:Uncharacterized protein T4A_5977 [Trichinella pseudospiralis]|uniref:Cytochrome b5 reductase 4 n=1 Tax=Trichinella pseudospiralis TaxID=6337 RepID=A0A0V1EZ35_TRIPS|nr:Uncharacterized protein T4A_5977 [Trichinella pseudospiralis]
MLTTISFYSSIKISNSIEKMLPTNFSRAHFFSKYSQTLSGFSKSHLMGCSATSKLDMSRKSGKVVGVRPGRSMLHWMNHCRNSSDMAKTGGKILNVTTEMLKKHSTLDDLWIAIQGKVYNVTPYVDFHPGGADILLQAAGSDGTALFNKHHPWVNFDSILKNCFVGYLNKIFTSGEHQLTSNQFLNCGKIVEENIKCSWCRKLDNIELLIYIESQKLFIGMCIVCVTSTSVHLIIHLCNVDLMFNWDLICKACPVESKINQCTDGQVRITIKTLESIIENGEIVKISKEISNHDKYQFKICKLDKIVKLAKDIFMFVLLLPFETAINVTIGCHMFWRLNDEKINSVQRPYTPVSNSMHEFENESFTCSLCFIIKLYDNGEMSSAIKQLKQGDQVEISRHFPSNTFDPVKLHNASKLIFLAAGTGLTPFCTLTPYSLKYTTASEILILIFNERKCDIFFEEEFRLLCDRYAKRLKIVRFLSKPEKSDLEQRGRVSNEILQEHLPKFQTDYYTFICGPNGFCQAAAKKIPICFFCFVYNFILQNCIAVITAGTSPYDLNFMRARKGKSKRGGKGSKKGVVTKFDPEGALRHGFDGSLLPPARQTASIFRQPVTIVTTSSKHSKPAPVSEIKRSVGRMDKPFQMFALKRLQGLRATSISTGNFIALSEPLAPPSKIIPVGPGIGGDVACLSVAYSLQHPSTGLPITGQTGPKKSLDSNPGANVNPDQPLFQAVVITEDDVLLQQKRVIDARRRLEEALKQFASEWLVINVPKGGKSQEIDLKNKMASKIIDPVMRRKLLADGDGQGDERCLNLIGQEIVDYFNCQDVDLVKQEEIKDLLRRADMAMLRSSLLRQSLLKELEYFRNLGQDYDKQRAVQLEMVEKYRLEVESAKLLRKHREQCHLMAQLINQYPTREQSEQKKAELLKEVEEAKRKSQELKQTFELRKNQIHLMLLSMTAFTKIIKESKRKEFIIVREWKNLYQYGKEVHDAVLVDRPNHETQIDLDFFFPYYGFRFNYTFISPNGFISFGRSKWIQPPYTFPNPKWPERQDPSFIAPFLSRATFQYTGSSRISNVWYRTVHRTVASSGDEVNFYSKKSQNQDVNFLQSQTEKPKYRRIHSGYVEDDQLLDLLTSDLQDGVNGANGFRALHALIVTWERMAFGGAPKIVNLQDYENAKRWQNTFQLVILTDEIRSYTIFNYATLNWTSSTDAGSLRGRGGYQSAIAGFNGGNGTGFTAMPYSARGEIFKLATFSSVSVPGRWMYRVDEEIIRGGCSNASSGYLVIAPDRGTMLGGIAVNITGQCLMPRSTVHVLFDELVVICNRLSIHRAQCVLPKFHRVGLVSVKISSDGGRTYPYIGIFYFVPPDRAVPGVVLRRDVLNYQLNAFDNPTPDLLSITWSPKNLTNIPNAKVTIDLFGYWENAELHKFERVGIIAENVNNVGFYEFSPKKLPRPKDPALLDKWKNYDFGVVRVSVKDRTDLGVLYSMLTSFSWYFLPDWEKNLGPNWALKRCIDWYEKDGKWRNFWMDLQPCPCTLDQALFDVGRFMPYLECDMNGDGGCYYHRGSSHCVMSTHAAWTGGQTVCCYDFDGWLLHSDDFEDLDVLRYYSPGLPYRAHMFGSYPYQMPPYIPSLSNWFHDLAPYHMCCRFADKCSFLFWRRQTRSCQGYIPPAAGFAYGGVHFITFDGVKYRFNGKGYYLLMKSDHPQHKLTVQIRLEQPPKTRWDVYPNSTIITGVALRENDSDVVQILARKEFRRWRYKTDVFVRGILRHFDTFDTKVQQFKARNFDQSEMHIQLLSGAGVVVREKSGMLDVTRKVRYSTYGLLGVYNENADDDLQPPNTRHVSVSGKQCYVLPEASTLYYEFGKVDGSNAFIGPVLFHDFSQPLNNPLLFSQSNYRPSFDDLEIKGKAALEIRNDDIQRACQNNVPCKQMFVSTGVKSWAIYTKNAEEQFLSIQASGSKKWLSCGPLWKAVGAVKMPPGNNYLNGVTVTFSCRPEYFLHGTIQRTCIDGTWTPGWHVWCRTKSEEYALKWTTGILSTLLFLMFFFSIFYYCYRVHWLPKYRRRIAGKKCQTDQIKLPKVLQNHSIPLKIFYLNMGSSNDSSNPDETTAVGKVSDIMHVCKSSQDSRCVPVGEYVQKSEALLENRFKKSAKLGTMLGVFLPTIQNIFGVIMFIRLHWIVGMAGLIQSLIIVSMCSCLTFLTSISLSAIATNGVFEEGGPYFVISRNLSPEFGAAIGILFFLANAVATAMYVVGHVEVFLTYVAQDLPQFGTAMLRTDEEMANNFRIYGTILLLIIVCIAACGVKVTQTFAPISLFCVIISIIGIYTGSFVYNTTGSERICMVGEKAIKRLPLIMNGTLDSSCTKEENGTLWNLYCKVYSSGNGTICDPYFLNNNVTLRIVRHGMLSQHYKNNLHSYYMKAGEAAPGEKGISGVEVTQDITSTFYTLLAIYFPAVTGIMTGCNLSGDLADPQHSIPVGTIAAQLTTSFVFISYTVFYGMSIDRALLMDKYGESLGGSLVSGQLSWPTEWLVVVGCMASTFGAGLQSLFSAARLIQAVAKDNLVAKLQSFGKVTSKNEPCRALLLSAFIAELTILIGAVDHIAPIVDFFFLICYCFINIACTLQTLLKMPNWRPRFKYYHWTLSLLGAILGFFIMFSTHFDYAVIVLIMCLCIYKYVEYHGEKKEWGHGTEGFRFTTAHYALTKLEDKDLHPKNWRPHVLLFIKPDKTKEQIMKDPALLFAAALEEGGGFLMLTTFIEMKGENNFMNQLISTETTKLKDVLKLMKIKAYVRVIPCKDVAEAVWIHTLGAGIGGLRPNIIITDWPQRLKTWKMTNIPYFIDAQHPNL